MNSWKVGVHTDGDTDYVYNGLRFKTQEEAEAYRNYISAAWTAVQSTTVEQDEAPVNSVWSFSNNKVEKLG